MNFKDIFLCFIILFLILITSGTAFADEAPAMELVENGTVSGDVVVYASNPWKTSGELEYTIPEDVDEIQSVNVVVTSYSGSGAPTYALYSNISLNTKNGFEILGYEDLFCDMPMTNDPLVYEINNHTTKQYSDYQSVFNITDKVKNLSSGDTIKISVENTRKEGYNFDARIKMIALIFAYDDWDDDKITYWLNIGQSWTQSTRSNLIKTKDFDGDYDEVTFDHIALSTYNGICKINDKLIYDPIYEKQGSYFIDSIYNITDNFVVGQDTNFSYKASTSGYGSFKSNIQLLKVTKSYLTISSSVTPEYKDTIYAGVSNNLTMSIKSNQNISAFVKLFNNKKLLYSDTLNLTVGKSGKLYFTDSAIRPIAENTVNGQNNKKVNYTVVVEDANGNVINEATYAFVLLYNGNLGKDFEYPNANPTLREFNIVGDVIVAKGSKYAGSSDNVSDVVNVKFDDDVSEGLLYVSYNWNNPGLGDFNTWNIAFNGHKITPVASYRDQSNLGTYAGYGYGLVVYDVSDFVVSGANKLSINKTAKSVAIYPASLIVLTDNDKSIVERTVYILEEADLLSKTNNKNLPSGFNSSFDVVDGNATLYVFAAGAQSGEGNLIINGVNNRDVWSGTDKSVEIFTRDVDSGNIDVYFESTGSTILGLHQMVVVENPIISMSSSLKSEYADTVYAGVNNTLTVTVSNDAAPVKNVNVKVLLNGKKFYDYSIGSLATGKKNVVSIVDSTIRSVNKNTVNGQNNKKVNYTVVIEDAKGNVINETTYSFVILYNGNLGKDYEYPSANPTLREFTVSGDVISLTTSDYSAGSVTNRADVFNVELNGTVSEALLYVPYTWDKVAGGDFKTWNVTFNGKKITPISSYRDQGNLGTYANYGYGLIVYNVTALVADGKNTFEFYKTSGNTAVYPSNLIILTNNDKSAFIKTVYILEEADLLSKTNNKNLPTGFNTSFDVIGGNTTLYVFAAGAQSGEGNLIVNGETYSDVWSGSDKSLETFTTDVDSDVIDVYFESVGSTVLGLHQMVVVENENKTSTAEITLKSEYADTVYAGVENNLTISVKNTGKSIKDVIVKLLMDNEEIGSQNIAKYNRDESYTLNFIDSTIRSVNKNTVNGQNNKKVNYKVVVEDADGNVINETAYAFVILYNGNLGKDFEYPNANPTLREFNISGDVIVANGKKYAGSSDNVSDVINVRFDGDVSEGLLYVSYNWNNPSLGDFTSWNIAFNGHKITPVADYRDQGNLGTYANYGYGLVVYDVSDFVVNGANKLSINKTAKSVAIYPASLIVLTDNDKSFSKKTVYILEEADLLSKTNNKNLPAGFNTSFDVIDGNATLFVFAAGAQSGEGNLIINGENSTDVWSGTDKSFEMYSTDVTAGNISVYFESTGATVLGLHQMVVVEIEKDDADIKVTAENVFEGENVTVNVNLAKDATGNVTVTVNGKEFVVEVEKGIAIFTIPDLGIGNYIIPVSYSGDDKYKPAITEVNVSVEKNPHDIIYAPDVIKYYKGPERLVVTVMDYKGVPIANKAVMITINGVSYSRSTNANGTTSAPLGLNSGNYTATVVVDNATVTSNIIILPTVNGTDVVKVFRNDTQYYATFRDSQGNYLAEGTQIQFNINGVFYERTIKEKGLAKLNLNLEQGNYVITAINTETGEKAANNITIIPRIVNNNDLTKYYRNASQYVVTVLGDNGKVAKAGEVVTFNINGIFYDRTVNASGQAKMNINLEPGDYVITAQYKGCKVSNKITVKPILSAVDITKKYGTSDPFVAKLVDGQGRPFAGEKITFNINGLFYDRTTSEDGQAKLNIRLQAGKYIITSSYNGSNIANKVTVTA